MRISMKKSRKNYIFTLIIAIIISSCVMFQKYNRQNQEDSAAELTVLQQGISEKILRFHVVANSDSSKDQELKLKVKEAVVAYVKPLLAESASVEESRQILEEQEEAILEIAADVIAEEGYAYPVSAGWENTYFPTKTYGAYTFPPGTYDAFMIRIGSSQGKNWWCVLYPPLCFVDVSHGVVDESGSKQLEQILTTQELEAVSGKHVKYRFRYLTFLNQWL